MGWNYYLEGLEKRIGRMTELHKDTSASISTEFKPVPSREQHIPIIDALVNDNEDKFQVNVPNRGAIEGIDDDVVVEVPGIVNGQGVQPMHVGALPKYLTLHILRTHIIPMELGLEAFKTGDKNILLNRILSDHRTRSYEQAQEVMDAIIALPFNEDLRKHFGG
jgi:alpha-galactosidase